MRIEIPDELVLHARARGMEPEDYVAELLRQLVSVQTKSSAQPRTPEQIRAWLDSLAQFSDKIPALPNTITREWIYDDHD